MRLRIVEDELPDSEPRIGLPPCAEDVGSEAVRRLRTAGYHRAHMRHLATGRPIPKELQYLKLQIGWVAETLSALDPIPPDFHCDKYWPA